MTATRRLLSTFRERRLGQHVPHSIVIQEQGLALQQYLNALTGGNSCGLGEATDEQMEFHTQFIEKLAGWIVTHENVNEIELARGIIETLCHGGSVASLLLLDADFLSDLWWCGGWCGWRAGRPGDCGGWRWGWSSYRRTNEGQRGFEGSD